MEDNFIRYKITPDTKVDNANNLILADAIQMCYKMPLQLIQNWKIRETKRVFFDIEISKKNIAFYLIVPAEYEGLLINKAQTTWEKSNIAREESQETFEMSKLKAKRLILKDFNFKSLSQDLTKLTHLNGILDVKRILREDEKFRVSCCFEPIKHLDWIYKAQAETKQYKEGVVLNKEGNTLVQNLMIGSNILTSLLDELIGILTEFLEITLFIDNDKPLKKGKKQEDKSLGMNFLQQGEVLTKLNKLSDATRYKETAPASRTSIILLTEAQSAERHEILQLSLQSAFKSLSLDNELIAVSVKDKYYEALLNHRFNGSQDCILSNKEIAKLIQLPQATLQKKHRMNVVETKETMLDSSLLSGKIRVGEVSLPSQNKRVMTYFDKDVDNNSFTVVIMGPEGCGKTYQTSRIAKESSDAGFSNFVVDFISDNKFSKEVMRDIPPDKRVIIEIKDEENLPCFAYPEVTSTITDETKNWDRKSVATTVSNQVVTLINSLTNDASSALTVAMKDLLEAAARVVFIHKEAKINDVIDVLENHEIRKQFIQRAIEVYGEGHHIISKLKSIDKLDSDGFVVGTNLGTTGQGIMNRFSSLRGNLYTEEMLYAPIKEDENIGRWIEQGKSIFLMIPQNLIPEKYVRDAIVTFYLSRLWLVAQRRGDDKSNRLCNIFVDEIHHLPTAASFIAKSVQEFRRHKLGLVISCHYLGQFKELEKDILKKRTNFIICRGFNAEDLGKIEREISPFTVDDIERLKQYEALCVIQNGKGKHSFIAKLAQKQSTASASNHSQKALTLDTQKKQIADNQDISIKKIGSKEEYQKLLLKIKNVQTKKES